MIDLTVPSASSRIGTTTALRITSGHPRGNLPSARLPNDSTNTGFSLTHASLNGQAEEASDQSVHVEVDPDEESESSSVVEEVSEALRSRITSGGIEEWSSGNPIEPVRESRI